MPRHPVWRDPDPLRPRPTLEDDLVADTVVIGGGITGLTAALLLARAGQGVVLLEARRLGDGVTGHTSAHLTPILDTGLADLVRQHGRDKVASAVKAQVRSIDVVQEIAETYGDGCGFARIPGYLYAEDPAGARYVRQQASAATQVGLPCRLTDRLPVDLAMTQALEVPSARFHPLRYLAAMAEAVEAMGSRIYEGSRVLHVDSGLPTRVRTREGTVTARRILLATHSPIGIFATLHTRMGVYRSYCIAFEPERTFPDLLLWDTATPYHYFRRTEEGLVILGGADHRAGHGTDLASRWDQLEAHARARMGVRRVVRRWSGQVLEPADGLPYIGEAPGNPRVLLSTGYYGNGLTWGTVGGMLMADLAMGHRHPWAEVFEPARVGPLGSAPNVVKDNVDVLARFVGDRLRGGDVADDSEIPPGEGRLMRRGDGMHAVYRDEGGELHEMSAVCSHMRCIVSWNDAEKSWDCPCHGGRYDAHGQVLDGPPVRALGEEKPRVFRKVKLAAEDEEARE